jgi:eukaryotic-like serine/threonine-protein kinase
LTHLGVSALLHHVIYLVRSEDAVCVSQGPSGFHRASAIGVAIGAGVAVLLGLRAFAEGSGELVASAAVAGALLVGAIVLLRSWNGVDVRFDRKGGIVVKEWGVLHAERSRKLAKSAVKGLVDRRLAGERTLEILLDDGTALPVARAGPIDFALLDDVAREVSRLTGIQTQFAKGVVLADRFEVEELVGRGGMGVVYRAHDRDSGQAVALKLILPGGDDSDRLERFMRESRLLEAIAHPRVSRHVAHGTTADGQAFLAMEWLEGENLESALERGRISLEDSLLILTGAAEAMAAVHARGVVHRDLKPANLFLRDKEARGVILLDFGIARDVESSTVLTAHNTVIGTPYYMAPEQASSTRDLLPAADIFSLGCIFYECLTGTRAFEASQLVGVLARILHDSPEPVRALRSSVPEAWAELLTRMLAKRREARPRDGAALLRELALLPSSGDPTSSGAQVEPSRERDATDQVLVCAVLAVFSGTNEAPDETRERLDSIQSAMLRFGSPVERLADGSLLATILPKQSATDQVRIAARCALFLRERLPEARIAVATGRAPLDPRPRVGEAVDRAAQLLTLGSDPGIRLDEVSARLLEGSFATSSRGDAFLLVAERPELDESRPLLGKPTPCVGRELELMQLEGVMASAVDQRAPKAALVVGAPGFGKSRLRHELLRRLRERHASSVFLTGYGDPLSAGSPYVLLGDALRRHAGIRVGDEPSAARACIVDVLGRSVDASQRQRVSEFLGELAGVPFPAQKSPPLLAARSDHRVMSEQIALAFVDWLAAECASKPVVIVLEDLQWGDTLTIKLLETALRDLGQSALFVLALGRPETTDAFPKLFGDHGALSLSLSLSALSARSSELLVKGVLGELDEASVGRIVRLGGGNPLFLEELIRAAAEGKAGDVPETVLAMLQARLSRLPPESRLLLRAASILGETFWQAGVTKICGAWGANDARERGFADLVDAEIVTRLRSSRFPGDVEYAFRHALVCDAANGLLTDADRRTGHLVAADWLEQVGETDAIVLARHARDGGDVERAVLFIARAAEQSLGQHDAAEALARANQGIAWGASGNALGVLESVHCAALYSMATWPEAAEAGERALSLLPRGGERWCATAERLVHMLPVMGKFARSEELSNDLLALVPEPEVEAAYLRAIYVQLLGYAIGGARKQGQACLDRIDELRRRGFEHDTLARGYDGMWRALFVFALGDDLSQALALNEQCVRDLEESQVMYRLSLAYTHQAFIRWGLGDPQGSERAARKGRAIAEQIRDPYHSARAGWYLALTLSEQADEAKLEEATRTASELVDLRVNEAFAKSVALTLTARVALTHGDWKRAEADGRAARAGLASYPPFGLMASAHLLTALVRGGRAKEALAIANEDFGFLERVGSPICSEVMFRVAAAEALYEGGQRDAGVAALREARHHIERRSAKVRDPAILQRFLEGREENRRAAELERAWVKT